MKLNIKQSKNIITCYYKLLWSVPISWRKVFDQSEIMFDQIVEVFDWNGQMLKKFWRKIWLLFQRFSFKKGDHDSSVKYKFMYEANISDLCTDTYCKDTTVKWQTSFSLALQCFYKSTLRNRGVTLVTTCSSDLSHNRERYKIGKALDEFKTVGVRTNRGD